MAGAGVRIDVEWDDAEARVALGGAVAALDNPYEMYDEIGQMLASAVLRRFEAETGPDGTKWTPSRRARKTGGQTLTDTARLRQSITHRADAAGVEVGSNVVYAAIHQFGGTIRKKARKQTLEFDDDTGRLISRKAAARRKTGLIRVVNAQIGAHSVTMPARPFLGISDQDRTSILDIVTRRLAEGLR